VIPRLLAVLLLSLPEMPALAQQSQASAKHTNQPSSQNSSATLDRMIAAGKSQRELARYVFNTHGCKTCHTMGHDGKLGFTDLGKQKAKGFEGCISMLTAMTVIVQVPEDQRRPEQRRKAERFEEFGCTACHKITPGKMDLTEVGAKLAHLHLGCVDVEKLMSSRTGSQN
jgi:cytochrome c2